MSAFPYILSFPDAEPFNLYTDRRYTLGQLGTTLDGRKFRFAYNATTLLVAGDVQQSAANIANHILQTPAVAGAVGDKSLAVTLGGTAMWANEYQDGVLAIELGTGFGYAYPLAAHAAVSASVSTGSTVAFKRGVTLKVAVPTTANSVSFIQSPYSQIIQAPTTATGALAGIAVSAIPASGASGATPQFGWLQVSGLAAVTTSGTVVLGDPVVQGGAAGAVTPEASSWAAGKTTTLIVGITQHVATTTNKSTILLSQAAFPV